MNRPCIINRRTGERYYLDEEEPHAEAAPPSWSPEQTMPAPPIYLECELCGRPEMQVAWTRQPPPAICLGCTGTAKYGLSFEDVSMADHHFLGRAHAVLKTLREESTYAR
jgi:hypothetical protein